MLEKYLGKKSNTITEDVSDGGGDVYTFMTTHREPAWLAGGGHPEGARVLHLEINLFPVIGIHPEWHILFVQ